MDAHGTNPWHVFFSRNSIFRYKPGAATKWVPPMPFWVPPFFFWTIYHIHWKLPIYKRFTHSKWWLSVAMLVYQGVQLAETRNFYIITIVDWFMVAKLTQRMRGMLEIITIVFIHDSWSLLTNKQKNLVADRISVTIIYHIFLDANSILHLEFQISGVSARYKWRLDKEWTF